MSRLARWTLPWLPGAALAAEAGPGFRTDLGLIGGSLDFLAAQPFVLLFLTLALGTVVGRWKLGFLSLGSTAGTLLVGILVSLWAFLGHDIRYEVPSLLTTVSLNLFMFAVGLKVGPQFFAGLRLDGLKFVAIGCTVVTLNFVIAFGAAKALGLPPGLATGLISGSMTDTAVIGAATGAVESGSYQPPAGVSPGEVVGNVAAGYAITYLFSLIGIILLIRYLPRLSGIDARAAARQAEADYGGGAAGSLALDTDAAHAMLQLGVALRAYRVENPALVGRRIQDLAARADVPLLRLVRAGQALDLAADPVVAAGDLVTLLADRARLVNRAAEGIGPEVSDPVALDVPLEIADIVVTNPDLVGLRLGEAVERLRQRIFPGAARVGRLVQTISFIRAGETTPAYPNSRVARGDIARVLGPADRIDEIGRAAGRVVRPSTASDILTLSLGLAVGYIFGYLHLVVGGIPVSLGTPAGVMLAGIAISTLRSRYPLFGGPVSEGARSLLQDLGLDLFIAVVALNTAPNVAAALERGGLLSILAIGLAAALVPPVAGWWLGLKVLKMNPAVLLGALCGARFSTPALRAAQEESGSAVAAVGYPVPYAITAVAVLVTGYLALFL